MHPLAGTAVSVNNFSSPEVGILQRRGDALDDMDHSSVSLYVYIWVRSWAETWVGVSNVGFYRWTWTSWPKPI